jgi:hypothetical protein
MSINYTTLFSRIGACVKQVNLWLAYQGTDLLGSGDGADAILSQYEDRRDLVTGVQDFFQSNASQVSGWISTLKGTVDATLSDLQSSLNAPASSPSTILPLMVTDMVANSQTVLKNTITAPAITTNGANTGNAQLLADDTTVAGISDERIINETISFLATNDTARSGTAGGESFSITGLPQSSAYNYSPLGNGNGPAIRVCNESGTNLLANGNFESWPTTNTPALWTLGTGAVAGTTIVKNTSAVHAATSTAALELLCDGVSATITITQNIASKVSAGTKYAAGAWARYAGSSITSGSNLQIAITGTGITTVNLFNADPSTLTASYALKHAFFNIGETIPIDLSMTITWTTAATAGSGAEILIDDVAVTQPVNFGNVYYALFRGSVDVIKGDQLEVVTATSGAGVFQSFFGRFYGVALPSASSPSISDSLAT